MMFVNALYSDFLVISSKKYIFFQMIKYIKDVKLSLVGLVTIL